MWFPTDTVTGVKVGGVWRVDFPVNNNARVLASIALTGPGGSVNVYTGTIFRDTTPNGDFNRADYYKGIPIPAGTVLSLVWDNGLGAIPPVVSIDCTDDNASLTGSVFTTGQ